MPTPELIAFGQEVLRSRTARGWTLQQLAHEALGNQERKGYLSQVEKGKKALSPLTIQRIAKPLGITGPVLDAALGLAPPEDEAPDPTDARAADLLARAQADAESAKLSEALLISLAYRFAETETSDPRAAHAGLEQALQAAQSLAAQGATLSNHADFIDAVFAEVARLNAEAREDDAAAAFETALAREEEESTARKQKLLTGLRDQHILRGDAEGLAEVQERLLRLDGLTGADLYHALRNWGLERKDKGTRLGLRFDLQTAVAVSTRCAPLAPDGERRGWSLNDLGIALGTLGVRGDADALDRAVATFGAALEVNTRDDLPTDWAKTQTNLGNALAILGERGDPDALHRAVAAYEAALEVNTRDALPTDWAMTQMNLGNALATLGERGDAGALYRAVAAYEAALEVGTRDALPTGWAKTQMNLGSALLTLGQRGDANSLRRAVAAYEAALEVNTRDALPTDWAMTKVNLGTALLTLGEHGDANSLRRAVAAYEAALEVNTRDALPLDWAMTRANQADCFRVMAEQAPDERAALKSEALRAIDDALTVITEEAAPAFHAQATSIRADIEKL